MQDLTFIIPIRVDTDDRIENCLTILRFLQQNFPESEILLMEQDAEMRTDCILNAFPAVKRYFAPNPGRFEKTTTVNMGIALATRPIICMYDTDILLHPSAVRQAATMLRSRKNRVVIPYNRIVIDVSGQLKSEISGSLDMEKFGTVRRFANTPTRSDLSVRENNGGIFIANKEVLMLEGGLNKKMISYGWEDAEFSKRFDKLGYYTFMLPAFNLVHLDHRRGPDSRINEMFDINQSEFRKVSAMTRRELQAYVETDLDIALPDGGKRRRALRRRQAIVNLLTLERIAHFINKVAINAQINGVSKFLKKFVYAT